MRPREIKTKKIEIIALNLVRVLFFFLPSERNLKLALPPQQAFLGDNDRGRIGEHGNELEVRAEAHGKDKFREWGSEQPGTRQKLPQYA